MVCVEASTEGEIWEAWAALIGRTTYFRFPAAGVITLAELEAVLGLDGSTNPQRQSEHALLYFEPRWPDPDPRRRPGGWAL